MLSPRDDELEVSLYDSKSPIDAVGARADEPPTSVHRKTSKPVMWRRMVSKKLVRSPSVQKIWATMRAGVMISTLNKHMKQRVSSPFPFKALRRHKSKGSDRSADLCSTSTCSDDSRSSFEVWVSPPLPFLFNHSLFSLHPRLLAEQRANS